jgi:hypothetical protein
MPARTLLPSLLLGLVGLLVLGLIVLRRRDPWRATEAGPRWRRRLVSAALALLALLGFTPPGVAAPKPSRKPTLAKASPLERTAEWSSIQATWKEAEEIASGKRGSHPFDRKGKQRMLERLADAEKQVDALARQGVISAGGAGLLKQDLQTLTIGVQGKRPTEMRNATCYRPMMHRPDHDAYRRIKQRLPLLEQLARATKIQPVVLRKVLVTVEADLARLGDKASYAGLDKRGQKEAARVVREARRRVARLKQLLQAK